MTQRQVKKSLRELKNIFLLFPFSFSYSNICSIFGVFVKNSFTCLNTLTFKFSINSSNSLGAISLISYISSLK